METVMWPQAERSHCLFAEGGKTTHRLLIQPHLGTPGSAASVCPGCPALITQGGGPGASKGVAGGPQARQDWEAPAFPHGTVKRAWAPDFADG